MVLERLGPQPGFLRLNQGHVIEMQKIISQSPNLAADGVNLIGLAQELQGTPLPVLNAVFLPLHQELLNNTYELSGQVSFQEALAQIPNRNQMQENALVKCQADIQEAARNLRPQLAALYPFMASVLGVPAQEVRDAITAFDTTSVAGKVRLENQELQDVLQGRMAQFNIDPQSNNAGILFVNMVKAAHELAGVIQP